MNPYTLTWGTWIWAFILIVGVYFGLMLLIRLLDRVNFPVKRQDQIRFFLRKTLVLYEPIALLLLIVLFVFINPYVHGLMFFLSLFLGYLPLKHFLTGRLFLFVQNLKKKQHIKVGNISGVIQETGYLGLNILTPDGAHFINYASLLSEGYVLLKSKKTGGLHELILRPMEASKTNHHQVISNKLIFCPYVDWSFKPEVISISNSESQYTLQVLVRKDNHLKSLIRLINDWGYDCERSK